MTKEEIENIALSFGNSVHIARESGFDCVEVHAGHGYLISQFLSPYTNHRKDAYGGLLENRMRFMQMVLRSVMKAAGNDIGVIVKTNMSDGFRGGMDLDECLQVARLIEQEGVHAVVLSGGFVSKAPMYVMRGSMPMRTLTYYMKNIPLKLGVRLAGRWMIPTVPFKEAYFLEDALKFRKVLKLPLIYVGGLTSREKIDQVLSKGFEFISMARALLNEPGFVNRMKYDEKAKSHCVCSNFCIARMYSVEMACHQHLLDLPSSIINELNKKKFNSLKTALITGGSSGIGYEIARQFAMRSYDLVIASNQKELLEKVKNEFSCQYHVNVETFFFDLSENEAAYKLYEWCRKKNFCVDILVNNAGMFLFGEVVETSPEKIRQMLSLHITTTTLLCTMFGKEMKHRRNGYIMNIASLAAYMPYPGIACYSASKRYLKHFSRSLRTEMLDYNVTVTCVCPGAVSTNLYKLSEAEHKKAIKTGIMINPENLARKCINALLRRKSLYIPGLINRFFLLFIYLIPHGIILMVRRYSRFLPLEKKE